MPTQIFQFRCQLSLLPISQALSKSASESNENPREGERNPPPSLLRGAAAAAGPPPPPSRRRRGDNITTIIRAGRGAGSSSVSSSVQRTCRAGGCAAEANPFPPSLLHNINTGRAAPRRTGSEPRSEPERAEGGRGAALPRGRRRRRSLRECERRRAGRGGLGTVSRYRAGGQGERRARRRRGKDPVCVSRSLSEQNADRKCSGRNDSLHRRQTPATSPFPPLPPPRPVAPWLHQRRFRRCSWRGSLASPLPTEPPLHSSSPFHTPPAAARLSLFFFFCFPPSLCLLVR